MNKVLKRILIALPVALVLVIAVVVISSYFEHRSLLEQEKAEFPAPGTLAHVDGSNLHVYAEGPVAADGNDAIGRPTLVFLSGLGTASPVFDFRPLYRRLSDDYRIAVVERAGYGWSDITDSPRDLDTVLYETRSALQLAGETPPYILLPHSLAGLEAIHWAAQHPDEVTSIIGLDPLVPEYREHDDDAPAFPATVIFLARSGLMRNSPDVFRDNFPAAQHGLLSQQDAAAAEAVFFRRLFSRNMRAEADMIDANARTVLQQPEPSVPFHAFISTSNENEHWSRVLTERARRSGGQYYLVDADHYLHIDALDTVSAEIRTLIAD